MRRKPMQGGGRPQHSSGGHNGGQRRHSGGGGGGGGGNYNGNRPRKNYPQLREKYINQARDALASGDRVMAEYYFQHADHCYRMMVEEGYKPQSSNQQQENAQQDDNNNPAGEQQAQPQADDSMPDANALPTFLTMGYTAAAAVSNVEKAAEAPAQNWEEN